jgi:IPT/TIG domain
MKDLNKILMLILLSVFVFACDKDEDPKDAEMGIEDFSPKSGGVGSEVTITGFGFSGDKTEMNVFFAGTEASIISSSESEIVVRVPQGAETGTIEVVFNFLNDESDEAFTVSGLSMTGAGAYLPVQNMWIDYDVYEVDENLRRGDDIEGSWRATVGDVMEYEGREAYEIIYTVEEAGFSEEIKKEYVTADEGALYNYFSFDEQIGGPGEDDEEMDGVPAFEDLGWIPVFKPNEDSWEVYNGEMDVPEELLQQMQIPALAADFIKIKTNMDAVKDGSEDYTLNGETLAGEKVVISFVMSIGLADDTPEAIKSLLGSFIGQEIFSMESIYWFSKGFGYIRSINQFPSFEEGGMGGERDDDPRGDDEDIPFGMEEIIVDYGMN